MVQKIPEKTLLKWNKELLELHKRVLKTYLVQSSVSASGKKKFFILYDSQVNEKNIMSWFFFPVEVFLKIILYNQLEEIKNYEFIGNKKHGKRTSHRK